MLGTTSNNVGKLYFLNIKDGKILHRNGLKTEEYSFVEGILESVFQRERDFNGETVKYWYINLRDENGDLYSLGFPYSSGVFKSIILSFAGSSMIGIAPVRIESYMKDGRTKVTVSINGEKLGWISKELPPVKEIKVGGKVIKDDSERMEYINSLVDIVLNRIK